MKLVNTIAVSNCHIATKDGETMIFDEVVDLSAYAGQLGDTPYYAEIYDGSGNKATAWIANAGGGEALGADFFSGWDLTSGWSTIAATINDSDTFTLTGTNGSAYKFPGFFTGRLYKTVFAATVSAGVASFRNNSSIVVALSGETKYFTSSQNSVYIYNFGGGVGATTDVTTLETYSLTDAPATGLHLVSTKDGSTRNLEADEGINPNDITSIKIYSLSVSGATSGIKSNQATLTATIDGAGSVRPVGLGFYNAADDSLINSVASLTGLNGTVHLASKDGEAMIFVDGQDLSAYAGTDVGSTPYLMIMKDTLGNVASAFTGAVGGGEALGADALSGWDLTSGWTETNATINDSDTFTSVSTNGRVYKELIEIGRIYKSSYYTDSATSNLHSFNTADYYLAQNNTVQYSTAGGTTIIARNNAIGTVNISSMDCYPLTDVPTTGLHLMSAKNGTTRNLAFNDTINPNTIDEIYFFNAFTTGDGSDDVIWSGLSPATAYSWYPKANDGTLIVTGDTVNFETLAGAMSRLTGAGFNVPNTDNLMGDRGIHGFNV